MIAPHLVPLLSASALADVFGAFYLRRDEVGAGYQMRSSCGCEHVRESSTADMTSLAIVKFWLR
jgi:hypothetical protein